MLYTRGLNIEFKFKTNMDDPVQYLAPVSALTALTALKFSLVPKVGSHVPSMVPLKWILRLPSLRSLACNGEDMFGVFPNDGLVPWGVDGSGDSDDPERMLGKLYKFRPN